MADEKVTLCKAVKIAQLIYEDTELVEFYLGDGMKAAPVPDITY
ncbi:hypothetical protein [Acetivibrio cellulolyticus]|nr:hypothetical protein [Acetivibrio cellulolyticus]